MGTFLVTKEEGKGYNNLYSLLLKFHWPSSHMVVPNFNEEEVQSYCIHKENILLTAHLPQYVWINIKYFWGHYTIKAVLHETDLYCDFFQAEGRRIEMFSASLLYKPQELYHPLQKWVGAFLSQWLRSIASYHLVNEGKGCQTCLKGLGSPTQGGKKMILPETWWLRR